jgi:hypothetical protein
MKAVAQIIVGLLFLLMISTGLRYVFNIVRRAVTEGGVRGLVLWEDNWNDAMAKAAARNKPLLVEFARESSPTCRDLAKKGWSRGDIVGATADYVPLLVDVDSNPDLVKQYSIGPVPSLLVIDAKTQSIIRDGRGDAFTPDELLVWLKPDAQPRWNTQFPDSSTFNSQTGSLDLQKSPFSP